MRVKRMNKKLICLLVAVALLVGYGFRVWYVNANAYPMYEEDYEIGEWVPLEGDYFNYREEYTDGYSLRISNVEVITYEEFIGRYNKQVDYLADASQHDVILLTVDIKNEDNDNGYLFISGFTLLTKNMAQYYNINETYEKICEPKIDVSIGQGVAKIRSNSEYSLTLAYTCSSRADGVTYFQQVKEKGYKEVEFYLNVSWYPTKKLIHFTVPVPDNPQ